MQKVTALWSISERLGVFCLEKPQGKWCKRQAKCNFQAEGMAVRSVAREPKDEGRLLPLMTNNSSGISELKADPAIVGSGGTEF